MSVEQQATRVASGAKSALKALIQKLGGTVPDSTKIDGYADIVDAMTLADMKPSSHASTHKTGGSDAIAPADIGAAASSHTHTKAQITDFPASMTPTAHKNSHKTGGSDAITSEDIGAQAKAKTLTLSLAAAGWSAASKTQTRAATGVTASNVVIVSPAPANQEAYSKAGVKCTAQRESSLTFSCESIPTEALSVNIVIL